MRRAVAIFAVVVAAIACTAVVAGCTPGPEPPACAPETLGAIEAAYVAEAVSVCAGHTVASCPGLAAVQTKYRDKREEWIRCRR